MEEIIKIDNISQVHDFLRLDKPTHPLVSVLWQGKDLAKVDFKNLKFNLDFYQVILKSKFLGKIKYGRNSYDFQEGTLVFTSPNQVITFDGEHENDTDEKAWSILFHPDLIRNSNLGQNIQDYSFFSYESNEALHLSDGEKSSLLDLVFKLEKEIAHSIDKHSQKLIVTNIELILDYCLRYYDRQFYTRSNVNKSTIVEFEKLLHSYYQSEKQLTLGIPTVKYCGEQLNLSPNYLSDLLKKETGRNAQEHIHFYVLEKAKTNLLNSKEPVGQIAFDLGFEYQQHFSKIFKSKIGMSPSEYRNMN